jgi:hypothetical protein
VLHKSLTVGDSWTQNYANNTLNLSTGSLVHITYWDSTNGTADPITGSTLEDLKAYEEPSFGLFALGVPSTSTTFDTTGSQSYGQIGSPTVTSVVHTTPVPNYGTVTPSSPWF